MSENNKRVCRVGIISKNFLAFLSAVSDFVSISAFVSLVFVPVGIASCEVEMKICAITAGIKNHKLIIKKRRRKITITQRCQLNLS